MSASSGTTGQHTSEQVCPCGSGSSYALCCGRFHDGGIPETAEQLMRARYTAYVRRLRDYLLESWHPSTRPVDFDFKDTDNIRWLDLRVKQRTGGGPGDDRGTVEFVARSKTGGRAHRLHELSRFVREHGRWLYLDGELK